jgi:hypothetical protein
MSNDDAYAFEEKLRDWDAADAKKKFLHRMERKLNHKERYAR